MLKLLMGCSTPRRLFESPVFWEGDAPAEQRGWFRLGSARRRTRRIALPIRSIRDVDKDLQCLLVFQEPHHFLVAIQSGDAVGEDAAR